MPRFFSRGLRVLDRLYRFDGSQVMVNRMDLDSPITVVHDVSRESELGAAFGRFLGFNSFSLVNTHAVARGAVYSTQDTAQGQQFWTTLGVTGDVNENAWLWLVDASIRIQSTLTFHEATLTLNQAVYTGAITNHRPMLYRWDTKTTNPIWTGGEHGGYAAAGPSELVRLPRLITPNAVITFMSDAEAAVANVTCQLLVQALPRGAYPAGVS